MSEEESKIFRKFAKHVFLASKVHSQRKKARENVDEHLHKMRRNIIRMRLSYSDIDRLKEKIENLLYWERKYAKFFKIEDHETRHLKSRMNELEEELRQEKEDKQRIIEENSAKTKQLTDSLNNIKSKLNELHLERTKRQQRLIALDKKIKEKVDIHNYFSS